MEFLPDPPTPFPVPADVHVLKAGARLWRIYFHSGKSPTPWSGFRCFGPTSARFDPHLAPPRRQARGILYAAKETPRERTGSAKKKNAGVLTAIAEVFQDTGLIDRIRNEPWLTAFQLQSDVPLLSTWDLWPVSAGGNMAINSGSHAQARKWSRAIYDQYPHVAGIWYPSSMTNTPCVALYERAEKSLPVRPQFNRPLVDPALLPGLTVIAASLNYDLR